MPDRPRLSMSTCAATGNLAMRTPNGGTGPIDAPGGDEQTIEEVAAQSAPVSRSGPGRHSMFSGGLSWWHWMIILAVFILLFGAKKLPEAARGVGRSLRILKSEVSAMHEGDARRAARPATPTAARRSPADRRQWCAGGAAANLTSAASAWCQ